MKSYLLYSLCKQCPKCGKGKLFSTYLKLVERCSVCGEKLGHIRADDGASWLTVLITGHIVIPVIFSYGASAETFDWTFTAGWILLTLILMLFILPIAKGLFIGMLWKKEAKHIEKT